MDRKLTKDGSVLKLARRFGDLDRVDRFVEDGRVAAVRPELRRAVPAAANTETGGTWMPHRF